MDKFRKNILVIKCGPKIFDVFCLFVCLFCGFF